MLSKKLNVCLWMRRCLGILLLGLVIIALASCSTGTASEQSKPATKASTPLSTQTTIPAIPAGTVLYQSDWSHGLMGWQGTIGWKLVQGVLQSDVSTTNIATLPYMPKVANYAIEVRFQIVNVPVNGGYFTIVADRTAGKDGYTAGILGLLRPGPHSEFANPEVQVYLNPLDAMDSRPPVSDYEPGTFWHTYRIEVEGPLVRFFIDDLRKSFVASSQTNFLSNGPLHLESAEAIVHVLSVRILAL